MTDQAAPAAPVTPTLPERPWPTNVIQALARVMEEMPGVGKDAQAAPAQGGYTYRSIEAITAAAQHLLGRYGVVFVPKVLRRPPPLQLQVNGKPWTQEEMEIIYTVYGPGGVDDKIEVGPLVALGRDNVDKGTNKCMTQAFKYALLQVLAIGDNKDDADAGSAEADSHANQQPDPEQWFPDNGWMDRAHHDEKRDEITRALAAADSSVKTAFRKWFEDQTEAPTWKALWPQPFALAVENRLTQLVDAAGAPFEPATAPQAAQGAPESPPGAVTPPEAETPAPAPYSAPEPMPWDGILPPAGSTPAGVPAASLEDARKEAVLDYVNGLTPGALTAALEASDPPLDISGTAKQRRTRLAKALVAAGWEPPQPPLG